MSETNADHQASKISSLIFAHKDKEDEGICLLTWRSAHAWLAENSSPSIIADTINFNITSFIRRAISLGDTAPLVEMLNSPYIRPEHIKSSAFRWAEEMIDMRLTAENSPGDKNCLYVLISSGADIEYKQWGKCALQRTALYKDTSSPLKIAIHERTAKILIDAGANWRFIDTPEIPKGLRQIIENHPKVMSDRLLSISCTHRKHLGAVSKGEQDVTARAKKPAI